MSSADQESESALREAAGKADGKVAVLEQVMWKRLTDAGELSSFLQAWISLLCRRVGGAEHGLVLMARQQQFAPAATWPEDSSTSGALAATLELAITRRQGAARYDPTPSAETARRAAVALPILIGDRLCGAAGLELRSVDDARLREAMRQLQWGIGWVRERMRQQEVEEEREVAVRSRDALDLVAGVAEDPESGMAARRAVTELAARFACTRVALGWLNRGSIRVAAVSHSAFVDRRMVAIRRIAEAMDEAVDQQTMLMHPAAESVHVLHAHRQLAEAEGGIILTIPLLQHDRFVGALLFERSAAQSFEERDVLALDAVAGLLGAVLEEKRRNDRWIVVKLWVALADQLRMLLGPAHFARKMIAAAAVAAAITVWAATGAYTVTADGQIEGTVKRAVVAELDGYLLNAPARAGDVVQEGDLLAALDERDLAFERLRWVTERQQRVQDYERAMGSRDRAATNIAQAQIAQTEAQIHLIDTELERTRMTAPFAGIVVSGDHTQAIGSAVKRGDLLYEVSPLDSYRLELSVDESQIGELRIGQRGVLIPTALPYESFAFAITKITPVTEVAEGHSVFRVEADLADAGRALRPGMKGVAKIDIDRRRLAWIWTHSLIDRLRLMAWSWLD